MSPWTSEDGYGALASDSTRRHSAITRSTTRLLPSLTAEDLKDLGVIIVGHRRKLLDAIAGAARWHERESSVTRCSFRQPTKPPRTPPNAGS